MRQNEHKDASPWAEGLSDGQNKPFLPAWKVKNIDIRNYSLLRCSFGQFTKRSRSVVRVKAV